MKNYYFNDQIGLRTLQDDQQEIKKIGNYIQHIVHLTPSQIKRFEKAFKVFLITQQSYIIPQDYSNPKNKKRFIVFLTKTQIKKVEKAKANKEKVDLKISKTQFKKTFNHVININNNFLKVRKEEKNLKITEKKKK